MYTITPSPQHHSLPFFVPYPQTDLYAELQKSQDRTVESFIIQNVDTTVGYFQIITFPLFRGMTSQYIPYGPVITQPDSDMFAKLREFAAEYGSQHNAVFTRFDFFDSALSPENTDKEVRSSRKNAIETIIPYKKISTHLYNTPYHQPRGEWVLDITPDPDELLALMHKKTRYNVNKSTRNGLETIFKHGAEITPWASTFIALNAQNTKDHGTTTHPDEYFKSLFALASQEDENFIAITRKDGHVCAMNVFIVNNSEAFCPFGASNDLGKKLGGYYHIKWHAILHMKEQNVSTFNWGGISISEQDSYLSGVTKFKTGFGGHRRVHPPLMDVVHMPWWYKLYSLRKIVQGLKK